MPVPVWPATLPALPLSGGYAEGFGESFHRQQMDDGPPQTRPKISVPTRPITLPYRLKNSAQLDIFEDFYYNTLGSGSLAFDYAHPRKGTVMRFGFVSAPDPATPMGLGWMIVLNLEIIP